MSAEGVSAITPYFRVCDGVGVRFADTNADSDITVLLLAPWPEILWGFRRIWDRGSAVGRAVGIDLPISNNLAHGPSRKLRLRDKARGRACLDQPAETPLGASRASTPRLTPTVKSDRRASVPVRNHSPRRG